MKTILSFFTILSLTSCSFPLKVDELNNYHLIIGIGVVKISDDSIDGAIVTKTKSFGVSVSDRPGLKFNLGYADSQVISVSNDVDNLIIEIEDETTDKTTIDMVTD